MASAAPPGPAPLPAPASAAPVVDPGWQSLVAAWLSAHKSYPDEARRRGDEGRVVVRFTVERDGRVRDASVVTGSGSALLDNATAALLRDATLPAFPPAMSRDRITITTAIRYSLR
jgi:periplasmic protein TonB